MEHSDVVAKALVQDPMGPGFESQVPQCICFIFLQVIPCDFQSVAHHTPSDLHMPNSLQAKSDGQD